MNKHSQPEASLNRRRLVSALRSFRRGDFSVRLDEEGIGDDSEIAVLFNEVVSLNEQLTSELERLSTVVGKEGKIGQRGRVMTAAGGWEVAVRAVNELLEELPPEKRHGLRLIDLVFIRPSEDIGRLSAEYEVRLPFFLRHLLRSAGARETTNPDLLSLLMFEPGYLARLMEIGEADGEARADDVAALLQPSEGA